MRNLSKYDAAEWDEQSVSRLPGLGQYKFKYIYFEVQYSNRIYMKMFYVNSAESRLFDVVELSVFAQSSAR